MPMIMVTFAVVFVPRIDTVLNAVAHQRVVNAHVAMAEKCTGCTGSCRQREKQQHKEIMELIEKTTKLNKG